MILEALRKSMHQDFKGEGIGSRLLSLCNCHFPSYALYSLQFVDITSDQLYASSSIKTTINKQPIAAICIIDRIYTSRVCVRVCVCAHVRVCACVCMHILYCMHGSAEYNCYILSCMTTQCVTLHNAEITSHIPYFVWCAVV